MLTFVSIGWCDGPAPSANERQQEKEEIQWRKKNAKQIRYDESQFLAPAADTGGPYRFDKDGNPIHDEKPKQKHGKKHRAAKKKISKAASKTKVSGEAKTHKGEEKASSSKTSAGDESQPQAQAPSAQHKLPPMQPPPSEESSGQGQKQTPDNQNQPAPSSQPSGEDSDANVTQ